MAEWVLKYWPIIAAVGGAGWAIFWGGWKVVGRLRGTMAEQQRRVDTIEASHKAHEDICAQRYQQIAERAEDMKERLGRVEDKMDLMLARLR